MNKSLLASACFLVLAASPFARAADYKPDGDGYIHNWLLFEPFELGDKAGDHSEDSQKDFFTKKYSFNGNRFFGFYFLQIFNILSQLR